MQKWLANVRVTLKPVDRKRPARLAMRDALHNLGFAIESRALG